MGRLIEACGQIKWEETNQEDNSEEDEKTALEIY